MVATSISGLKGIVRRFERYIRKKRLELNVNKSKVIQVRKETRGRREIDLKWKGEEIEEVKTV